jgi:hypothetical protein
MSFGCTVQHLSDCNQERRAVVGLRLALKIWFRRGSRKNLMLVNMTSSSVALDRREPSTTISGKLPLTWVRLSEAAVDFASEATE